MRHKNKTKIVLVLLVLSVFYFNAAAYSSWDISVKAGYDSNVDRAVENGMEDFYLSPSITFSREPAGESRLDWNLSASLEGTIYNNIDDLSYAGAVFAPGIVYFMHRTCSINLIPFIHAKVARDTDQSAIAFGGKVNLRQPIGTSFYLGEYYIYKNSKANEDVYSFNEHSLGIYAGMNWSASFFTEIGYEYSHGDSFRSMASSEPISYKTTARHYGYGKGKHYRYSNAFGEFVFREPVGRNSIGFNAGIDISRSISSLLNYTFTSLNGDSGTSESHAGFVSLGYRF